jgi:hypothetical protein
VVTAGWALSPLAVVVCLFGCLAVYLSVSMVNVVGEGCLVKRRGVMRARVGGLPSVAVASRRVLVVGCVSE